MSRSYAQEIWNNSAPSLRALARTSNRLGGRRLFMRWRIVLDKIPSVFQYLYATIDPTKNRPNSMRFIMSGTHDPEPTLYCVRVTAFSQTDLFLDWISREWDSHRSPMTNYKKLSWRHRVTDPELPLIFDLIAGRASLKINLLVKTPFHRRCMEVARSRWAPNYV